jgi:threonine/homoserine/homoserine lactone efflux protein
MLSLGAINIATWREAMKRGYLVALQIQLGATGSDFILVSFVSFAVTTTPLLSPTSVAMGVITVLTIAWLLWFAYSCLRDAFTIVRTACHRSAAEAIAEYLSSAADSTTKTPRRSMRPLIAWITRSPLGWGFAINFFNPATLFYLPTLAAAAAQSHAQHALLLFIGVFIGTELVLGFAIATVATLASALFRCRPRLHVCFIVTSSLLAAVLFFVVALQFALPLVSSMVVPVLHWIAGLF